MPKRFVVCIDGRTDCVRTVPQARCDSVFCSTVGRKSAVTSEVSLKSACLS